MEILKTVSEGKFPLSKWLLFKSRMMLIAQGRSYRPKTITRAGDPVTTNYLLDS